MLIGYARVSTKEQVENLSLPTQLERCREYCERAGLAVAQEFVDQGESAKTTDRREFQRKVRTVVRGIDVLAANARLLNPVRHGVFAWQLLSHKLCRWLVPFAMLVALASNAMLAPRSMFYLAMLLGQAGFYAAALAGHWTGIRILKLPSYLVVANVAVLMAWVRYARGERITTWNPSERVRALPQTTAR